MLFCHFSHFVAVYLCKVAGLAETFPLLPGSNPFLPDVPGFQVPSDSVLPSQPRSSSKELPLYLHFGNCCDVFSFISSFDVPEPFRPSKSAPPLHPPRSPHFSDVPVSSHPLHHRTILISVVNLLSFVILVIVT